MRIVTDSGAEIPVEALAVDLTVRTGPMPYLDCCNLLLELSPDNGGIDLVIAPGDCALHIDDFLVHLAKCVDDGDGCHLELLISGNLEEKYDRVKIYALA